MREASGRWGDCATRIVAVCGPVDLEGEGQGCHPDVHAEEKALRSGRPAAAWMGLTVTSMLLRVALE